MPTKNNRAKIRPLSLLSFEELRYVQDRLPNPLPPRFATLFLIDTQQETYFLLDIADLSEEIAQKHKLLFEKIQPNAVSISHTVSEIRRAYHENDIELLDQLRINLAVSQALEIIGTKLSVKNLSKMEDALICSISQESFIFPMLTPYGQTYEKDVIVMYLKQSPNDPLAFKPCAVNQLIPNKAANQLIQLVYQYANADQKKKRTDSLKAKKEELFKTLVNLSLNSTELPMEAIFQEKEKLIKKRDRLSGFSLGWIPVLMHALALIISYPLILYIENFLMGNPLEEEIENRGYQRINSAQLKDLTESLQRRGKIRAIGFLITVAAVHKIIEIRFSKINEQMSSINAQIAQLSDWIDAESDTESLQLQLDALDRQIVALNKLSAPQKAPTTDFFQNIRRRVKDSSSELSVDKVLARN